jgi:hypothetical protein
MIEEFCSRNPIFCIETNSLLIPQANREEGYSDPAMAAQDAMVTRCDSPPDS